MGGTGLTAWGEKVRTSSLTFPALGLAGCSTSHRRVDFHLSGHFVPHFLPAE
jgi:hypothetical protein